MNNQFQATEAQKIILNTVKEELFPILNQLKELLVNIQKCRIRFFIYSKQLGELESNYSKMSTKFFTITRKLETPDILFAELNGNPQENITAYMQFETAVSKSIEQGAKYVEIIDRTLDRKNQSIQNFRTLLLAVTAILASFLWK